MKPALSQSAASKRTKCRELIGSLSGRNSGVISTQVMQEFYVAAAAKLGAETLLIKDILKSLERFETVVISPPLIKDAIDCALINRPPFRVALIAIRAESTQCEVLRTEELNHGQVIRGVPTKIP